METKRLSTKPYQVLSGSTLKLIACVSMLADHLAKLCFSQSGWANVVWFSVAGKSISLLQLMLMFGRLAFPLFAFLLVEGFLHTGNKRKYGLNLLALALISEIPFNLLFGHSLLFPKQNVMFTLLLGYMAMCSLEHFRERPIISLAILLSLFLISRYLQADYRTAGFVFILLLYGLRREKAVQCVAAPILLEMKTMVFLSLLLTCMYNGKRGFIKTPFLKYFFYAFYPLHMLIIYFLAR